LAEAGIIVLVIPKDKNGFDLGKITVVSRGFVFMKEALEVVEFIKLNTAEIMQDLMKSNSSEEQMKKAIEKRLGRRVNKVIRRTPMIVPVFVQQ
jgi:mRNA degradation ribonuclease J1/J2